MVDISTHDNIPLGQLDPSGIVEMPPWLNLTKTILTGAILVIFLPILIYVLSKTRRGLDTSIKLILFAFTLNFILRFSKNLGEFYLFTYSATKDNEASRVYFDTHLGIAIQMVISLFERLKWLILYFFILEMKNVQIKLFSESLDEFKSETRKHRRRVCVIITIYLLLQIPILSLQYTRKFIYASDSGADHQRILLILEGLEAIFRSLKLPIDSFLFYQYMRMLHFFISFKGAKLRANLMRFSCLNHMIITIAFTIAVLLYYSSVSYVIYITLLFFLPNKTAEDNGVYTLLEFEKELFSPFLDLLTSLGILYLSYSLGIKKVRAEAKQRVSFNSFRSSTRDNEDNKRLKGAGFDGLIDMQSNRGAGVIALDSEEPEFNFQRASGYSKFGINQEDEPYEGVPILNPFSHFVDNLEKYQEYDRYEKEQTKKSMISKASQAKTLRQFILVQMIDNPY